MERNQCVVLHLAAAYEWVLQGCPRRPPSLSRVHTVGMQLRQSEYQQASECMVTSAPPSCMRDYEVASSAHDVLSAHHDRGFEDLDLFFSTVFSQPMMPLVVIEVNMATQPPRTRALVFSNSMDFSLERTMVLGVWNNHTRLLLPAAETTPALWTKWQDAMDSVVIRSWGSWCAAPPSDQMRVLLNLEPCTSCQRRVRVPASDPPRGSGISDRWWGRWNPCSHQTDVTQTVSPDLWSHFPTVLTNDESYVGRGKLDPLPSMALGTDFLPDCRHMWRSQGPCRHLVGSYTDDLPGRYTKDDLCALAVKGDQLIQQRGGVYPALVEFQENQMRKHNGQMGFASEHKDLFPVQYPAVVGILDQGVRAVYNRGVGFSPRVRGLPYNTASTDLIAENFWKDIRAQRLFVCSTLSITLDTPIEATPTTTVEKKNPDRSISHDRRVIAGLRRVNVGFDISQFYPVRVPSVESIARLLASLTVLLPGFDIEMTKRDIASAFRLLRLHPALALVMCTELPGGELGQVHDVVVFYLVMPFGWNGSPANFAVFGDSISLIHAQFGMGRPDWFLPIPFLSRLYVDDGLLFDIKNAIRQLANTTTWEAITVGVLGDEAINQDKLDEEGDWSHTHTMLGFDIDSSTLSISLPDVKVAGARVLFEQLAEKTGPHVLEVVTLQQIRGHVEHFKSTNSMWKFLTGPIDLLLRYTDERAVWVNCPVPEIWQSFWNSLSLIFDTLPCESRWKNLFRGSLMRLLTPDQRLSIRLDRVSPRFLPDNFVWVSVDATLELLGGLSWGDGEFFRCPTNAALPHFRPPVIGEPIISECELVAATMAIMTWAQHGCRNIVLCTDNMNVLSWVEHARSHSPIPNRILRALNTFCLLREVDVLPVYVRSEHNSFADGITRWTQGELTDWATNEGMVEVDAVSRLWANMALPYNPGLGAASPPNTFAILGYVLHFYRAYNYRICEWRPSHFAIGSVLENWGVPVFSDQLLDVGVYELLVRRVSQSFSLIGDKDIFLLVGLRLSLADIQDFRHTIAHKSVRYAAMILPFWLRDGIQSALWTSQTVIDSALTGDPWASGWVVYCAGGISSHHFDLSPASAEVRTLGDCYRLIGHECEDDPTGVRATHTIPNSVGKVTVVSTEWGVQYSRFSHIPLFSLDSLHGATISWPRCVSTGSQPTPAEKITLLGGHIGLLCDELTIEQCARMTPRLYPAGVARHILRAAQNHFESCLPSASTQGRAGGGTRHDKNPYVFLINVEPCNGARPSRSSVVGGVPRHTQTLPRSLAPLGAVHERSVTVTMDLAGKPRLGRPPYRLHHV